MRIFYKKAMKYTPMRIFSIFVSLIFCKCKIPKVFLNTYPIKESVVITLENYLEWLV